MNYFLAIISLFLVGCGMKQKVSGKVDVTGTVEHRLSIEELEVYFRALCSGGDADKGGVPNGGKKPKPSPSPSPSEEPSPEPTEEPSPEPSPEQSVGDLLEEQEQIEECVAEKLAQFLESVQ